MSFSFFDVLLLIGITQGLVAVLLLLFAKKKRLSNTFLALVILTFCLLFIKIIMNYSGLSNKPEFRYFPNAFELSTAPLFYFYFLALTEKDFNWNNKYLIHFIPFAIAQGYAVYLYLEVYNLSTVALKDQTAQLFHYTPLKEVEDWLIVISILSYLYFGYRKYVKFQKQVRDNTADNTYPTLKWFKTILVLCIILFSYLLINMLLSRFTSLEESTELHWKLYFIYQAAVTYYLGFMAYHQQEIDLDQIYPSDANIDDSLMYEKDISATVEKLEELLKHKKIYLDPNLNISKLSKKLEINSSNLSQVINSHYNQSFRSFINDYRIKDVKAKLLEPKNKASILSLALESGFNSEASFYRIFKATTGLTPKAFIGQNTRRDASLTGLINSDPN